MSTTELKWWAAACLVAIGVAVGGTIEHNWGTPKQKFVTVKKDSSSYDMIVRMLDVAEPGDSIQVTPEGIVIYVPASAAGVRVEGCQE